MTDTLSPTSYVAPPPRSVLPANEVPDTGMFWHDLYKSLDRPLDQALLRSVADSITPDTVITATEFVFFYVVLAGLVLAVVNAMVRSKVRSYPLPRLLPNWIIACTAGLAAVSASGVFPLTLLAVLLPVILHWTLFAGVLVVRAIVWPVGLMTHLGRPTPADVINAGALQTETLQAVERTLASLSTARLELFQARTASVFSAGTRRLRGVATPEQAADAVRQIADPVNGGTLERWADWVSANVRNMLSGILIGTALIAAGWAIAEWLGAAVLLALICMFDFGEASRFAAARVRKDESVGADPARESDAETRNARALL